MISSMRRVCCISSSRHALPVTMVMPSTSTLGDCRKTIIAIWLEPPGPEPSWSMRIRRFWSDCRVGCDCCDEEGGEDRFHGWVIFAYAGLCR